MVYGFRFRASRPEQHTVPSSVPWALTLLTVSGREPGLTVSRMVHQAGAMAPKLAETLRNS